jgi:hypothetical protein
MFLNGRVKACLDSKDVTSKPSAIRMGSLIPPDHLTSETRPGT